jgi:hypothetical protein
MLTVQQERDREYLKGNILFFLASIVVEVCWRALSLLSEWIKNFSNRIKAANLAAIHSRTFFTLQFC